MCCCLRQGSMYRVSYLVGSRCRLWHPPSRNTSLHCLCLPAAPVYTETSGWRWAHQTSVQTKQKKWRIIWCILVCWGQVISPLFLVLFIWSQKDLFFIGANVQKGRFLDTPLHAAAQKDCPDIIRLLLEFGANINARNLELQRPVETAPPSSTAESALLLYEGNAAQLIWIAFGCFSSHEV